LFYFKKINIIELKTMANKSQTVELVKKTLPAVVSIVIAKNLPKLEQMPFDLFPFFGLPFDPRELYKNIPPEMLDEHGRVKVGGGSGFFISKDGLILTNKHVVADPRADYSVVTNDGKKLHAKVVARDPINDVAMLKVEGKSFPTIEMGDSSGLDLGEDVIAIGNALGQFQNTVSTGVVSGLSRNISAQAGMGEMTEQLRGVIQTDAAINPGNSGGPLINADGEAVGINAAVVFGAQNIGFAIPINAAKKAMADIKKYGRIRAPFFGVRYTIIDPVMQKRYSLPVDYGALVIPESTPGDFGVIPHSPADKAGILERDIILEVDGAKVTREKPLQDTIQQHEIGDKLRMKLLRKGKEMIATCVLEEMK